MKVVHLLLLIALIFGIGSVGIYAGPKSCEKKPPLFQRCAYRFYDWSLLVYHSIKHGAIWCKDRLVRGKNWVVEGVSGKSGSYSPDPDSGIGEDPEFDDDMYLPDSEKVKAKIAIERAANIKKREEQEAREKAAREKAAREAQYTPASPCALKNVSQQTSPVGSPKKSEIENKK